MRTMVTLCSLLGHRRDKRRARLINNIWRSKCERCDAALERDASGKWNQILENGIPLGLVRPDLQSPVNPFSSQAPTQPKDDSRVAKPLTKVGLPQDLVNELVPHLPAGDDDRFYYLARAEEARLLAEAASEHRVKVIHLEMVERYYTLAYHCLGQRAPISRRRMAGTNSLRAPARSESGL